MPSPAGAHLFSLGPAAGLSLLTLTSYRRVSPAWLKRVLLAGALCLFGRYAVLAMFAAAASPESLRILRVTGWFITLLALILPSIFAVDQLLRHPAMTPKKLLIRCLPFFAAASTAAPFPWWCRILHAAFALAFVALCIALIRKIPSRPFQLALLVLAAGQSALAFGGLYAEMAMLLVLWFAYESAAGLQQAS